LIANTHELADICIFQLTIKPQIKYLSERRFLINEKYPQKIEYGELAY
jgi:hypothetical protein